MLQMCGTHTEHVGMLSGFQHQHGREGSIHHTGLLRTPGTTGSYTGGPGHIPEGSPLPVFDADYLCDTGTVTIPLGPSLVSVK